MAEPSKKRQAEIAQDAYTVHKIYNQAVIRFGKDKVNKDLKTLWDMRCILGVQGALPFSATRCKNMNELLWVARNVCMYGGNKTSGKTD